MRFRDNEAAFMAFAPQTHYDITYDMGLLVTELFEGKIFDGRVADDSLFFRDAAQSPYGFVFVFWDVPTSMCSRYSFPPAAALKYRPELVHADSLDMCSESWGSACFNCGTYPRSVGIPVPETTGMFDAYIPSLAAQDEAYCRCYVAGQWRPSAECDNKRDADLFQSCVFNEPA